MFRMRSGSARSLDFTIGVNAEFRVWPISELFACLSGLLLIGIVVSAKKPDDRTPTMHVFLRLAIVLLLASSASLLCSIPWLRVLFAAESNVCRLLRSLLPIVCGSAAVVLFESKKPLLTLAGPPADDFLNRVAVCGL